MRKAREPVTIAALSLPGMMILRAILPWLCFLSVLSPAFAPAMEPLRGDKPVMIEADSIAYDEERDVVTASGGVVIRYEGNTLAADTVALDRKTNIATAEGNVVLRSEKDVIEGERAVFNTQDRRGVVYQGKMFLAENHFYLEGSTIEKVGAESYRATDAAVTTCDGDAPDWRIRSSEMDVTVDGYGTLKHGRFYAGGVPVLYVPYFLFPAKTTRQSGFLLPRFAYSMKNSGLDLEVPFYWAISEDTDATFFQRYMEKRGFKEGMEFRYAASEKSFGTFYADYLKDRKQFDDPDDDIRPDWQGGENRWSLYWNHQTTFPDNSYLRADIRKVSDRWYFRDFTGWNYYLDHYATDDRRKFDRVSFLGDETLASLDSTVRFVRNWDFYNLTVLGQFTDNFATLNNDATLQRYPEITLTGTKRPIFGGPAYLEFTTAYDYFYRTEGQKGHFYDLQPIVSLPLTFGDYAQFTPQFLLKGSGWSRDDQASVAGLSRQGDRALYSLGATLSSEVHRIFSVGGKTVDKIRHGIRPEISYIYTPYEFQGDAPDFVTQVFEQHTVTYGVINTLMAKLKEPNGKTSYREFLRFKLSQSFDIRESRRNVQNQEQEKRPFSDVDLELDLLPHPQVSFSARNKYSVNSGDWKQTNYDLGLSDKRGDSITLGYRYAKSGDTTIPGYLYAVSGNTMVLNYRAPLTPLQEVNLALKAVITERLEANYIIRENRLDNQVVEESYGVRYKKQCWSADIAYVNTPNDRRFTIMFVLYGLGKAGF
ncbi:MAG: LPS-assembly protein LptD precursor [Syntrophaceae bacterium PtaU1.Bin231]|nr:MAG: LPS-assembly protein LptD precursor [Syntrophaceae bacterium PtaU1.Bin231]